MRRLLLGLAILALVGVLALVAALRLIEPATMVSPLVEELSARIERPVQLGGLDLSLLPAPSVRIDAVRVGGSSPGAPPLLEIDAVRARIALLPLLLGHVVLGALELDAPRIHLDLDDRGRPVLPGTGAAPGAGTGRGAPPGEEPAGSPPLAVRDIRIAGGSLRAGPWEVERIDLRGRLHLDRTAEVRFEAELPGLARIRGGHLRLRGLGGPGMAGELEAEVEQGDLEEVSRRLALEPALRGRLDGPVAASFEGASLQSAEVRLRATGLEAARGELRVEGDADLEARLGGPWRVDLTGSRIRYGKIFEKPRGLDAVAGGTLGREVGLGALGETSLTLGPSRIPLRLDLDARPPRIGLSPTTLDLEPLSRLVRTGLGGLSGKVKLASLQITPAPLGLSGSAELQGVEVRLERGPVTFSGPVQAEGTLLRGRGLQVRAGGQPVTVSGTYDLASGRLTLEGGLGQADLEALVRALAGSSDLAGTLDASFALTGPPRTEALGGSGRFEIREGRIRGFSLLRQLLGDLAALPVLVAQLKGKDLSRFEEEEFRRLAGDVRLRQGRVFTENLTLEYRHATAYLHGSIGVLDGSLDLGGRVVIAEDVDAAIAGTVEGRRKEFRIEGITGTVSRPRVRIDRRTLAELAAGYAGQGPLRDRLEEKIGKEGADQVEQLLERILRGPER